MRKIMHGLCTAKTLHGFCGSWAAAGETPFSSSLCLFLRFGFALRLSVAVLAHWSQVRCIVVLSLCMALQVSSRRLLLAPAASQGFCKALWSKRYAQDYAGIMHGEGFA